MDETPRQDRPHGQQRARLRRDNWRMFGKLSVIVVAMTGFGYALVPMYETICDALGINVLSVSERVTSAGLSGSRERKQSTQVDY
jgi:cytochrome c oxidase assembly protein subunit 11